MKKLARHVFAVDIGGSKMAFLAREEQSGLEVHRGKVATPAGEGVEAALALLEEEIEKLPGGRASLAALGVAVPGAVDLEGNVLLAGNLEGWVDVPLRRMLAHRYGVPTFVDRDSNCGALGEKWCGAATGLDSFVFLALGTGVGAGLFLDGRLYRGAHFASGEAGDLVLAHGDGWEKLNDVLGKGAIQKKVEKATGKRLSAADALSRAPGKRKLARATEPVIQWLAAAVVALTALLDPQAIVFGGGTSEASHALLGRVRKASREHLPRLPLLLHAKLRNRAQVHGALWGALQALRAREERGVRRPRRIALERGPRAG